MIVITSEIIASFRTAQPAFTDENIWPCDIVEMALCKGDVETGGSGWGAFQDVCTNFKRRGMYLFAAHFLAVAYPRGASNPTDMQIDAKLNVAAKSVGDESVTFRVGAIQDTGDDWLSLSNFGVQYLRLRRRVSSARAV